MGVSIFVHKVT